MKNFSLFRFFLTAAILSVFTVFTYAQGVKTVKIPKREVDNKFKTTEALEISKHLETDGYKFSKTIENTRYTGKDSVGTFEVELIVREYKNKEGKTYEQIFLQTKRGKSVTVSNFAENETTIYRGPKPEAKPSCTKIQCVRQAIKTGSACANCVSKVEACINNNRKKTWKQISCILSTCVGPCISCVGNMIILVSCMVNCKD
jgi:hypothetical protein